MSIQKAYEKMMSEGKIPKIEIGHPTTSPLNPLTKLKDEMEEINKKLKLIMEHLNIKES